MSQPGDSKPEKTINELLFGLASRRRSDDLPAFAANDEASEAVVVRGPVGLAFPFHTLVVRHFFEGPLPGRPAG